MLNLVTLAQWDTELIADVLALAKKVKENPADYANACERLTLLMIFEKPSLRTRLSFETAMTQMGGHGIYYDTSKSPMGAGKESVHDTVKAAGRFVDIIMARLFEHRMIEEMAKYAPVPVINALTNFTHPCQILGDFQTIIEKKGSLKGIKFAYVGDSNNNVTHSLLFGASKTGMQIHVGCPEGEQYSPKTDVLKTAREVAKRTGAKITITHSAKEAVRDADVVYTDSWMSYHIPADEQEARVKDLMPFQVNASLMSYARPDAIFMNCLPALRGFEQTTDVIDGPNSVVFDEAENRLHAQKAVILKLLGKY